MIKFLNILLLIVLSFNLISAPVSWQKSFSIGDSSLHSSSLFDVISTSKGSKPAPAMTTTQRDAIASPQAGLTIYNTTTGELNQYNGSVWTAIVNKDRTQTLSNKNLDNSNSIFVQDANLELQDNGDTTRKAKFQLSGITAGNTRVMTVPDSDFTFTGNLLTQTLQNKTLDNTTTFETKDTLFTLQDNIDSSKKLQLELSGISTTTTRTLTIPDASTTIVGTDTAQALTNKTIVATANTISGLRHGFEVDSPSSGVHGVTGNLVGTTDTQSLSNKSFIDAPSFLEIVTPGSPATGYMKLYAKSDERFYKLSPSGVEKSLTPIFTPSAGSLFYSNGTADLFSLTSVGTPGQYLQSNGSGTPSWSNVPASVTFTPSAGNVMYSSGTPGVISLTTTGTPGQYLQSNGTGTPTWSTVVSSSGVNNIDSADRDAESSIGNWATYSDAASNLPTDGTGGSPNVTYTHTTSTPLAGTGSFLFTKDAANRQGQGASVPFNIRNTDRGSIQYIKFDAAYSTGTYSNNESGTYSDLIIYIYDVTNARLIEPAGFKVFLGAAELGSKHAIPFQTSIDSTSYRLIIHTASTSASAYTVKFDNFSVGPESLIRGAIETEWRSFTPTGSWVTNTTYSGYWRRVGDTMQGRIFWSLAGAPNSANLTVDLPSGYSIDTAKLPNSNTRNIFGHGQVSQDSTGFRYKAAPVYNNTTSFQVRYFVDDSTGIRQAGAVSQAAPVTWANNDNGEVYFEVPIAGWSSSSVLSSDAGDGRAAYVGLSLTNASLTTTPAALSGSVDTAFLPDNMSTWSTNKFTAPVSGVYLVTGEAYPYNFAGGATYINLQLYKNGVVVNAGMLAPRMTTATSTYGFASIIKLNRGDYLQLFASTNAGTADIGAGVSQFQFALLPPGSQSFAATESVNARAVLSGNQSGINPNNSDVKINLNSISYDSHVTFNTSTYRYNCPASGLYSVDSRVYLGTTNVLANIYSIKIYKNGSLAVTSPFYIPASAGTYLDMAYTDKVKCLSGEYLELYIYGGGNNSSSTLTALAAMMAVTRVGN